jgi:hypothetical protein
MMAARMNGRLAEQTQHVGVDDGTAVAHVGGDAGSGVTQLEQET